jgi:hypothetical protein
MFSLGLYLLQDFSFFPLSAFVALLFVHGMHQFLSAESILTTVKDYFNSSVLKLLDLDNKYA